MHFNFEWTSNIGEILINESDLVPKSSFHEGCYFMKFSKSTTIW